MPVELPAVAAGTPAGARMPNHPVTSKPGRAASAMVGTSGSTAERAGEVTASARSLPPLSRPMAPDTVSNWKSIVPASSARLAGPEPRKLIASALKASSRCSSTAANAVSVAPPPPVP